HDQDGLRHCACRPCQDGCEGCDESPCAFSSHLIRLHVSSLPLVFRCVGCLPLTAEPRRRDSPGGALQQSDSVHTPLVMGTYPISVQTIRLFESASRPGTITALSCVPLEI